MAGICKETHSQRALLHNLLSPRTRSGRWFGVVVGEKGGGPRWLSCGSGKASSCCKKMARLRGGGDPPEGGGGSPVKKGGDKKGKCERFCNSFVLGRRKKGRKQRWRLQEDRPQRDLVFGSHAGEDSREISKGGTVRGMPEKGRAAEAASIKKKHNPPSKGGGSRSDHFGHRDVAARGSHQGGGAEIKHPGNEHQKVAGHLGGARAVEPYGSGGGTSSGGGLVRRHQYWDMVTVRNFA